jgi:hypothetical protein
MSVEARSRAALRLRRQRDTLRPLGWAVIAVVAAGTVTNRPGPSIHGAGLAVAVVLVVFAASLAAAVTDRFIDRPAHVQLAVITAMGTSGAALAALQPHGATELAAGAAVWMALTRLPLAPGLLVGAAVVLLTGGSSSAALAAPLLCLLLGLDEGTGGPGPDGGESGCRSPRGHRMLLPVARVPMSFARRSVVPALSRTRRTSWAG